MIASYLCKILIKKTAKKLYLLYKKSFVIDTFVIFLKITLSSITKILNSQLKILKYPPSCPPVPPASYCSVR